MSGFISMAADMYQHNRESSRGHNWSQRWRLQIAYVHSSSYRGVVWGILTQFQVVAKCWHKDRNVDENKRINIKPMIAEEYEYEKKNDAELKFLCFHCCGQWCDPQILKLRLFDMTFKKNSPINFHSHLSLPIQQRAFPMLKSLSQISRIWREDWTRKQVDFLHVKRRLIQHQSRPIWRHNHLDDCLFWDWYGLYFSFLPVRFCWEYLSAAVTVMKSMCFYYKPPDESPHADWMMIISKPVKMSQILSLFIRHKKNNTYPSRQRIFIPTLAPSVFGGPMINRSFETHLGNQNLLRKFSWSERCLFHQPEFAHSCWLLTHQVDPQAYRCIAHQLRSNPSIHQLILKDLAEMPEVLEPKTSDHGKPATLQNLRVFWGCVPEASFKWHGLLLATGWRTVVRRGWMRISSSNASSTMDQPKKSCAGFPLSLTPRRSCWSHSNTETCLLPGKMSQWFGAADAHSGSTFNQDTIGQQLPV